MTRVVGTIRNKRVHVESTGEWITVKAYYLDGVEVTKEAFDAEFPSRLEDILGTEVNTTRPGCWPMKSRAMGCHPSQIPEANEAVKGTGCSYNDRGELVIPDAAAKKKVLRRKGMTDFGSFN